MKGKKRIVIVIVAVVVIIALVVGGMFLWKYIEGLKNQDGSGLKVASNVVVDEDKVDKNAEERVQSINVNLLKALKLVYSEDGTASMKLNLHNGNEKQYMFTITVDNQEIYRSDLIPAGADLEEITLKDVGLDAGEYEAVIIFNVISEKDNQTVLGSTGIAIPLTVE